MSQHRIAAAACVLALAALCSPAAGTAADSPVIPLSPGAPGHGRAWELISSPDAGMATVINSVSVAPDGNAVAYQTLGPLPDFPSGEIYSPYALSVRGLAGWRVEQPGGAYPSLLVEQIGLPPEIKAFGPGDQAQIWSGPLPGATRPALFLRTATGAYSLLQEDANFLGASPDLRRVVFSSPSHFLPEDAHRSTGESIYESDAGVLRLLDPTGVEISGCGVGLPQLGGIPARVSDEATRTYFEAYPDCGEVGRVYLAERGVPTRVASVSRCSTDCGEPSTVKLRAASPDGAHALLSTEQKLTDSDSNAHVDLYRYDAVDDDLSLISSGPGRPDLSPVFDPNSRFPAVRVSADGARSFFTATDQGEPAEAGIYLADGDGAHRIADAATAEIVDVTTDGRYAFLNSTAPLAPGDSDGQADAYRYDSVVGSFTRLSQGSAGGNGPWPAVAERDETLGGSAVPGLDFKVISEDGSRAFFVTEERLVPQDTNELGDVYEWHGGDVGLVSSGAGTGASTLLTATPDGATVLFKSRDALLPSDRDGDDNDIYAARIGGGFQEAGTAPGDPCPCGHGTRARVPIDSGPPASARPAGGRIAVARPTLAALHRFAERGWIELLAEVPGSGALSAEAKSHLGRRTVTVASTVQRVAAAGPAQLRLRLSKKARHRLGRDKSLRIRVSLRLSGHPEAGRSLSFELGGSR